MFDEEEEGMGKVTTVWLWGDKVFGNCGRGLTPLLDLSQRDMESIPFPNRWSHDSWKIGNRVKSELLRLALVTSCLIQEVVFSKLPNY